MATTRKKSSKPRKPREMKVVGDDQDEFGDNGRDAQPALDGLHDAFEEIPELDGLAGEILDCDKDIADATDKRKSAIDAAREVMKERGLKNYTTRKFHARVTLTEHARVSVKALDSKEVS